MKAPITLAIIATGDELVSGDILNTNAKHIATLLLEQGIQVGTHLVCDDKEKNIRHAIEFALQEFDGVILTGGLGPTSDDRTRFALSDVLQRPLLFHEPTWQALLDRLTQFGLSIPESNRQQALFPSHAHVLPNTQGTAAGCFVQHNDKLIFMLPGPPCECLPMFQEQVLPILQQHAPQQSKTLMKWRLFGVSEGHIATELENLLQNEPCDVGYRIEFPYVEFKLTCDESEAERLQTLLKPHVEPHLLAHPYHRASSLLQEALSQTNKTLLVLDQATGGALERTLRCPENAHNLFFNFPDAVNKPDITILLTGLQDYWQQGKDGCDAQLRMDYKMNGKTQHPQVYTFPMRKIRAVDHAVEYYSYLLLQLLEKK